MPISKPRPKPKSRITEPEFADRDSEMGAQDVSEDMKQISGPGGLEPRSPKSSSLSIQPHWLLFLICKMGSSPNHHSAGLAKSSFNVFHTMALVVFTCLEVHSKQFC